jgi:DNA-binding NarL/FixJ family response regulator
VIRVLIADDQALLRSGLRMILDAHADIEVVGEAGNGHEALELARRLAPDLVLMDVQMPVMDGLEATRRLLAGREPHPRVVVLTTFDLDEYVYAAIRAGACGFLLKTAPPDQLAAGVRAAMAGDALLAPEVTRRLLDQFVRRPPPGGDVPAGLEELTVREREVLHQIGRGRSNREIATELFLGEATVKTHVNRILSKLGARDRVQAVVIAYETGLVTPGEREEHP